MQESRCQGTCCRRRWQASSWVALTPVPKHAPLPCTHPSPHSPPLHDNTLEESSEFTVAHLSKACCASNQRQSSTDRNSHTSCSNQLLILKTRVRHLVSLSWLEKVVIDRQNCHSHVNVPHCCRALLAAHPEQERALAAELDAARLLATPANPSPRPMTFSDLPRLTYLDGVRRAALQCPFTNCRLQAYTKPVLNGTAPHMMH